MHFELAFVILFTVATAVAIAARWLRLPYTVALVLAGLILGATHAFEPPHLTKELVFGLILPGLIFEAAFHIDARRFWKDRIAIAGLALPGLLVAIVLTALILAPVADALAFVSGFSLTHALVFGALISATDPIAVVGLFKSLGAPKRLALLVEGESLLNDGTGIVVFTLAVAVAGGAPFDAGSAVIDFVRVAGLGILVGAVVGFAVSQVINRIDEAMIELTLTVVAAYGSFVLAEVIHASGVMATVAAGMLCGNYAARVGMSPTTRVAVETFWEYVAFALNSIVFLLIGFEVNVHSLLAAWQPIVVAFLAVLVGRAVVVYTVSALLRRTKSRMPWTWSAVLTWSGLRGALSMVLVLSLNREFPHRELLVNMTFGVVVLSILLQGITMSPLVRRLRVAGVRSEVQSTLDRSRVHLKALGAAIDTLAEIRQERSAPAALLDRVQEHYDARIGEAEGAVESLHARERDLQEQEELAVRRRLLVSERDAVVQAARKGMADAEVISSLLADIDGEIDTLEATRDRLRTEEGAPDAPRPPPPDEGEQRTS